MNIIQCRSTDYSVYESPLLLAVSVFSFILLVGSVSKESGDSGSIPRSGRSPRGGNGNPLHYSCLKNPMDQGAKELWSIWLQRVRHDRATSLHFKPNRLLHPWDFSGKNSGVGCPCLLQGIFPTGIEPTFPGSPASTSRFFTMELPGKSIYILHI